jgi:hypothetical protein
MSVSNAPFDHPFSFGPSPHVDTDVRVAQLIGLEGILARSYVTHGTTPCKTPASGLPCLTRNLSPALQNMMLLSPRKISSSCIPEP